MNHESDMTTRDEVSSVPDTMRAIVQDRYGPPAVLRLSEIPTPTLEKSRVLVRVAAASLNFYDWHLTTGKPYMARAFSGFRSPKSPVPGADVAGTVVGVGSAVEGLSVGDRVMGEIGSGAFAEFASAGPSQLTPISGRVSFEQAASTPLAAITALQGLRDLAKVTSGHRVMINGASGGVGTFAVQLAKVLGAEVTAVCSTAKVEMVRSIGADRVIDYMADDFTEAERGYDVLFDNVGNRRYRDTSRVLAPGGIIVATTGPKHAVFGPLRELLAAKVVSFAGDKRFTWFTSTVKREDLEYLAHLLSSGELRAVIERRYSLEELPGGLDYLGEGHVHGKLVVNVAGAEGSQA